MASNLKLLCDPTSEIVDATVYRQMIGSLMYLTSMRSDICFAMKTLSQYMVEPRRVHLVAAKHILRYLKGTIEYGLNYVMDQKTWLCLFILGRQFHRQEEHFNMLLQFGIRGDLLAQQEEAKYGSEYN